MLSKKNESMYNQKPQYITRAELNQILNERLNQSYIQKIGGSGKPGFDYVVYLSGLMYKALNGLTGHVDYSNTDAYEVFTSCIGGLDYGGNIKIRPGLYNISDELDFGEKSILFDGSGCHKSLTETVTEFRFDTATHSNDKWFIKCGNATSGPEGIRISNIFFNGEDRVVDSPFGGILFRNIRNSKIEQCMFDDFYKTSTRASAIKLYGDTGYGCYYNQISNCHTRRCTNGIELGTLANATMIMGGVCTGRTSSVATYGIYGSGGNTNFVSGIDLENHAHTNGIGFYLADGSSWKCFGLRFEGNYDDIVIDSGGGTGNHAFFGGSMASTINNILTDNGNAKSFYRFAQGFITMNRGVASSVADGGNIAHGLSTTPTMAIVTPITSGEFVSVTGKDATNLTVAIKKHDGSAGTTQNLYWYAEYLP